MTSDTKKRICAEILFHRNSSFVHRFVNKTQLFNEIKGISEYHNDGINRDLQPNTLLRYWISEKHKGKYHNLLEGHRLIFHACGIVS